MIFIQDPDEMPERAKCTIMVTSLLLLTMCLILVGVTLRMTPLIDDIGTPYSNKVYLLWV